MPNNKVRKNNYISTVYLLHFVIYIFIFLPTASFSQEKRTVDSLLHLADNATGIEKINLLNKLGEITISTNPQKSYEYISDAIKISKELDNKEKAAYSFILLGKMYQTQGKHQKAISSFQIAQSAYESIDRDEGIADVNNYIGITYYYMGEYDKSLESYQQSLKIFEHLKNYEKMVKSLNNIGVVYDETRNYNKALEYYNSALIINRQLKDLKGIAVSLNNIGNCYYYNGEIEKSLNYYYQSVELKKQAKDYKGLANSYFNLARIFFSNENYNKALNYYEKCQDIEVSHGFMEGLTNTYLYLGYTYNKLADNKKALMYFSKSLSIADSLNLLPAQKNCFAALSDIYYNLGRFEQAFDYYREYTKRKDEIFDEEKHNQIAELETKFQVEKKEQEIVIFESEIKRQKLLISISITGIICLLIFLLLVIRQYRQNRRINRQLEKYNKEIESQKMDITSSIEYAQRIQAAILPEKEHIQKLLPDNFILYLPKDIVSGDFYWIENHDDLVYAAVVDCTGHGVPGAFMSLIGNTLLNEILTEKKIYRPSEMLNMLNHLVKISLKQDYFKSDNLDGMDIAICAIDRKKMKLYYAGANRDLYIIRNNEMQIVEANHTAIAGITEDGYCFINHETDLISEDLIYMSSDGFSDQFGGAAGKKYMSKNFRKTLLNIHQLPLIEQKDKLLQILEEWKGQHPQIDDILIMCIKIV